MTFSRTVCRQRLVSRVILHDDPQQEVWTRISIPPDHSVSNVAQWHINYAKHQIVCDGNGGHEWLRFNHELSNFTFHVKWRFLR